MPNNKNRIITRKKKKDLSKMPLPVVAQNSMVQRINVFGALECFSATLFTWNSLTAINYVWEKHVKGEHEASYTQDIEYQDKPNLPMDWANLGLRVGWGAIVPITILGSFTLTNVILNLIKSRCNMKQNITIAQPYEQFFKLLTSDILSNIEVNNSNMPTIRKLDKLQQDYNSRSGCASNFLYNYNKPLKNAAYQFLEDASVACMTELSRNDFVGASISGIPETLRFVIGNFHNNNSSNPDVLFQIDVKEGDLERMNLLAKGISVVPRAILRGIYDFLTMNVGSIKNRFAAAGTNAFKNGTRNVIQQLPWQIIPHAFARNSESKEYNALLKDFATLFEEKDLEEVKLYLENDVKIIENLTKVKTKLNEIQARHAMIDNSAILPKVYKKLGWDSDFLTKVKIPQFQDHITEHLCIMKAVKEIKQKILQEIQSTDDQKTKDLSLEKLFLLLHYEEIASDLIESLDYLINYFDQIYNEIDSQEALDEVVTSDTNIQMASIQNIRQQNDNKNVDLSNLKIENEVNSNTKKMKTQNSVLRKNNKLKENGTLQYNVQTYNSFDALTRV